MSLIVSNPTRQRARFHDLLVSHVERLTPHSVALSFEVPAQLRRMFDFAPGQYLTLRAQIEGVDVRRSYSICSTRAEFVRTGQLRVASALVPGGVMSTWLTAQVRAGDTVAVLPPMGEFTVPTRPQAARHHVAVVAGSGITPVMSLIGTALEEEPRAQATVIFGNRATETIMFFEDLREWQTRYPGRVRLINVLSQEETGIELLAGRIDPPRMRALIEHCVPSQGVDEWYLCGPHAMVAGVQLVLRDEGVDPGHVHQEVFYVPLESAARE